MTVASLVSPAYAADLQAALAAEQRENDVMIAERLSNYGAAPHEWHRWRSSSRSRLVDLVVPALTVVSGASFVVIAGSAATSGPYWLIVLIIGVIGLVVAVAGWAFAVSAAAAFFVAIPRVWLTVMTCLSVAGLALLSGLRCFFALDAIPGAQLAWATPVGVLILHLLVSLASTSRRGAINRGASRWCDRRWWVAAYLVTSQRPAEAPSVIEDASRGYL